MWRRGEPVSHGRIRSCVSLDSFILAADAQSQEEPGRPEGEGGEISGVRNEYRAMIMALGQLLQAGCPAISCYTLVWPKGNVRCTPSSNLSMCWRWGSVRLYYSPASTKHSPSVPHCPYCPQVTMRLRIPMLLASKRFRPQQLLSTYCDHTR